MVLGWKGIVAAVLVATSVGVVSLADQSAAGITSAKEATAAQGSALLSAGGLTKGEETAILAAHNAWRSRYGSRPLRWDATLAKYAQQYANLQAKTGRRAHRAGQYGENLAWTGGSPRTPKWIVNQWGNEVKSYNLKTNTCAPTKSCGHFTQVVWKKTTAVGCARATGNVPPQGISWKGKNFYYVCNYKPRGNRAGLTFRTG